MNDEENDSLPAELEYLRKVALEFVGSDREIVGCGQVDFSRLEQALRDAVAGLNARKAAARREEHQKLLRQSLAEHQSSNAPLVVGMRFVAALLREMP